MENLNKILYPPSQNVFSLQGNSQKRKEKSTIFISSKAEENIKRDKLGKILRRN